MTMATISTIQNVPVFQRRKGRTNLFIGFATCVHIPPRQDSAYEDDRRPVRDYEERRQAGLLRWIFGSVIHTGVFQHHKRQFGHH